jgi:tRNA nucleotidyltransferase (CCA-adding enzyme)
MESQPSRMFEVLHECGALERIAPQIAALFEDANRAQAALAALDAAARDGAPLEVRFASLVRTLDPFAIDALAQRLKPPAAVRDLALLAARHANAIADAEALPAESILELFNAADAWRRPERFEQLLHAALAAEHSTDASLRRLRQAHAAAAAVDAGAAAKATPRRDAIRDRVDAARLAAIRSAIS